MCCTVTAMHVHVCGQVCWYTKTKVGVYLSTSGDNSYTYLRMLRYRHISTL